MFQKKTQILRVLSLVLLLLVSKSSLLYAQKSSKVKKSKSDYLVSIGTQFGKTYLVLFEDVPKHRANFLKLVEERFYDGTTFHFVLEDFMILGGDMNTKPNGNAQRVGMGTPGYTLEAEINEKHKHKRGTLGAARQKDELNPKKRSSGSHFYIVQGNEGAPHLDGEYSAFGEVIRGMDVVDKIASREVDDNGKPLEQITLTIRAEEMKKKKITKLFGYKYED